MLRINKVGLDPKTKNPICMRYFFNILANPFIMMFGYQCCINIDFEKKQIDKWIELKKIQNKRLNLFKNIYHSWFVGYGYDASQLEWISFKEFKNEYGWKFPERKRA